MKRLLIRAALAGASLLAAASAAHAGGNVYWSIGINAPLDPFGGSIGTTISNGPAYHRPPPVFVQPEPIYYTPAPVYYAPPPMYYAPAPVFVRPRPIYITQPAPHHQRWRYGHHDRHQWDRRDHRDHDDNDGRRDRRYRDHDRRH